MQSLWEEAGRDPLKAVRTTHSEVESLQKGELTLPKSFFKKRNLFTFVLSTSHVPFVQPTAVQLVPTTGKALGKVAYYILAPDGT